jgi:hypothetical protein
VIVVVVVGADEVSVSLFTKKGCAVWFWLVVTAVAAALLLPATVVLDVVVADVEDN